MYALVAKDWRELSKAASQESDPKKFMELIEQLNEELEREYGVDQGCPAHDPNETHLDAA
ncbi:MAG TPA: hypothetical protein VMT53_06715 [Terriglobales bacterium]|nr:hypothetical protein [Terriglobales bacterium]